MEGFFTLMLVWLIGGLVAWSGSRSQRNNYSDEEKLRILRDKRKKSREEFHEALRVAKNAWKM